MHRTWPLCLVVCFSVASGFACDDDDGPPRVDAVDGGGGTGSQVRDGGLAGTAGAGGSGGAGAVSAGSSGNPDGGTIRGDGAAGAGAGAGGNAGSGGTGPVMACPGFTACGGDPVGDWTISEVCGLPLDEEPIDDCPGGTSQIVAVKFTGTFAIRANGTYTSAGTTMSSQKMSIPPACIPSISNAPITCAQLQTVVAAADPVNIQGVACANRQQGGCDCTLTFVEMPVTTTGTWMRNGNALTLTAAGDDPQTTQYCVQGNRLLVGAVGTMAPDIQSGYVVLRK